MPMLVTRKGTSRSFIHAANLVNLLFAFIERSAENIYVFFFSVSCLS